MGGISVGYWLAGLVIAAAAYYYYSQKNQFDVPIGTQTDRGAKVNTRSSKELIKVLYGQQLVGGNDVYIQPQGNNNKYLWIVQTLAECECEGIAQVDGVDQVWLGDRLASEFGSLVSYWFHNGSSTQTVDTNLAAVDSNWTDPMRDTCYMVWRLEYDKDYFQYLPTRTVLLKGRKLYDYRDTTTAYSTNGALALYDYMTNDLYGMGWPAARFDASGTWTATANYIDTKGWELNLAITTDSDAADIVEEIYTHFRGALGWYDNKFYLRYADLNYESSVMTLNDEHIAVDSKGKAQIAISEPSTFNKPDGLKVTIIDPDKDYVQDDIFIGESEGNIENIRLLGAPKQQGLDLAVYFLERKMLDRTISGTFRDDALKLEPHDVITLNTSALDISDQLMRVMDAVIQPNGLVNLVLAYEDLVLYDDDFNLNEDDVYECDLPDPFAEPPSVTNASISEEQYDFRGRTFTRLKITFDPPSNYSFYDHCEVYISFDDSTWTHQFNANTDFNIDPVEEGRGYYIRLKVVNIYGVKQQDANDYKLYWLVMGQNAPPASLPYLYAIVTQNGVNIFSEKVDDPDIALYEFRLGPSWTGGIFLAALASPNLSLTGVKPGSHKFWANTLGTNGQYGVYPRFASVSLIDPPDGWSVTNTETCDYDGVGTHNNTEHTTYDSDDYLQVIHPATGNFIGLDQPKIYYRGMCAAPNGDVYASVYNDDIYIQYGGEGDFMALGETARNYRGICAAPNGDIYVCVYGGDIYKRSGGTGSFVALGETSRNWTGMAGAPDGDIYACVIGGDIYKQTGGTGSFNALGETSRMWNDMCAQSDGDIYACVNSGDIYKQTGGSGSFNALGQTSRLWQALAAAANGDVYCAVYNGDIYKQTGGSGDFNALSAGSQPWTGMAGAPDGDVYACVQFTDIYRQSTDAYELMGIYTSPIYDRGSSGRYMVYLLADIVVTGEGTEWGDILPLSTTLWAEIDLTRPWYQIFELTAGPRVEITILYGAGSPPSSQVKKMEILSGIVTGRYFQVRITITDPSVAIRALVEHFTLKFCQ